MEEKEVVEHLIKIDEFLTVTIKIPKVMTAIDFKGLSSKANKIFNLSEVPMIDTEPKRYINTEPKRYIPFTVKKKKMGRKMIVWTPERLSILNQMREEGGSTREISNRIGLTVKQIDDKICHLRILASGKVARKVGRPKLYTSDASWIKTDLSKESTWTPQKVEILEQMKREGFSTEDIANSLSLKTKQVIDKWYSLNKRPKARRYRKRANWTPQKIETLIKLRAEGVKISKIAEVLGLRNKQVESKIYNTLEAKK